MSGTQPSTSIQSPGRPAPSSSWRGRGCRVQNSCQPESDAITRGSVGAKRVGQRPRRFCRRDSRAREVLSARFAILTAGLGGCVGTIRTPNLAGLGGVLSARNQFCRTLFRTPALGGSVGAVGAISNGLGGSVGAIRNRLCRRGSLSWLQAWGVVSARFHLALGGCVGAKGAHGKNVGCVGANRATDPRLPWGGSVGPWGCVGAKISSNTQPRL